MSRPDVLRAVFGSESDGSDDDAATHRASTERVKDRALDDDATDATTARAEEVVIDIPYDPSEGDFEETAVTARRTNVLGIRGDGAWRRDASTAEDADAALNVIRYRIDPVTGEVETNARFVRWGDGTTHLVIGDEHLRVTERATAEGADSVLYARKPGAMEARKRLRTKMTFAPASLESKTHRALSRRVDKAHGSRATRTRQHVSRVDPEREKEAVDAALVKAEREQLALKRKQEKMMRDDRESRHQSMRGYTESYYERRDDGDGGAEDAEKMDADFLEADEDVGGAAERGEDASDAADQGNADDDDDDDDDAAPKERRKRALIVDEDDE